MDASLRLLLVADASAAAQAVAAVRRHSSVEPALAPTPAALASALRDGRWDAVLVIPGGPVADADVVKAMAGLPAPLVVVAAHVPPSLASVAALAVQPDGLDALPSVIASLHTGRYVAEPAAAPVGDALPGFVSAANATLAACARPPTDLPGVLTSLAPEEVASPAGVFVAAANATLSESARATAALAAALAAASDAPPPQAPAPRAEAPAAPRPAPSRPAPAPPPRPDVMTREAETLAQHLPVGVYRTSPDGRVLYANPALAEVLGLDSVADLARLDVGSLGYPREAFTAEMLKTGSVRNHTVTWTNPRGQTVHTRENARSVLDDRGDVVCYEGTMEDVTAEVQAHRAERARARHHEAVARFAEAADAAQSVEALAEAAVAALHAATEADWVLLVHHTPASGNTVAASAGRFPTAAAERLAADPAFIRMPVRPEPLLARDAATAVHLPTSIRALMHVHGMRALGAFPLHRAGTPLGALVVGYDAPHTFSQAEQQAAETLAWHLAGHVARHDAEQDLLDADASLRFIAAHSAQVLYRLRYPEGGAEAGALVFDYLSPAVEALTGYAPAALAAQGGLAALVEHRDVYAGAGLFDGPTATATHYHAVYRLRTASGATRHVENHAYPWHDASGQAVGLVGGLQDVTERRRHEDALADAAQQALTRQSALVELSRLDAPDALFARAVEAACHATDADGAALWLRDGDAMSCPAHFTAAGAPRVLTTLGAEIVQALTGLIGEQRALAISDLEADARIDAAGLRPLADSLGRGAILVAPVRRGGAVVGLLVLTRDAACTPWPDSDGDFAAAIASAVALAAERSDRDAAERALRRSETRYRLLSDLTSDYAFAVSVAPGGTAHVDWTTDAFSHITGYSAEDLEKPDAFWTLTHPDSREALRASLERLEQTGEVRFESCIATKTGETRWLEHSARVAEPAPDGARITYHSGRDISERKAFEEALVAAREQAETMVRLKSAFLANMSHEIRTPLTAILGYAELLEDEVEVAQRPFVASISQSGTRLLDTLNSVLDLARLESEGIRPELHPVDVADEVRRAVRALEPLAARRGLALEVETEPATAALDAMCLGRIVTNLVGNALKFTEAGHVRVSVRTDETPDGAVARITVSDTGIGIDAAFLPHLFDEFRQETDGPGRSHEGSGLGLSITRRLADLMGGEIAVESQRPGGSAFTVTFPALAVPSAPEDPGGAPEAAPAERLPDEAPHPDVPESPPDAAASPPPPAAAPDRPPLASRLQIVTVTPAPAASASAPTPMFDFQFSSPGASEALPPTSAAPDVVWTSAPVAMQPEHPQAAAPAPVLPGAPRPEAPPAPPPVMIARPVHPDDARTAPPLGEPPAPPTPPAAPTTPAPPPDAAEGEMRLPILVVEDNLDTRVLLDRILRGRYDVTAVGDARSALAAMAQTRFRGLVLDINLGGKETGTDVLRIARALDGYADVFAVALTAYALPGDRERLIDAGFDEYISKPFTRQSLMDTLGAGIQS